MDRLWAPWRNKFIKAKKRSGCIFCIQDRQKNKSIIKRSVLSFALLNIYPYNNGHIMVSPYRHVRDLTCLTDAETVDLMGLVKDMQSLLQKKLKPHGFNIGINTGRAGGAGYEEHLHVHIVPRWNGDVNFMPVIGNTKIIPQSLNELSKLLKGN